MKEESANAGAALIIAMAGFHDHIRRDTDRFILFTGNEAAFSALALFLDDFQRSIHHVG